VERRPGSPEIEPDFALRTNDDSTLHSSGVDPEEEDDTAYCPPIDPVVTTDRHGNPRVLGGFSSSSMESIEVEPSSDGTLGDEAIVEAILRELREDAATTALQIDVRVAGGVAHLHGTVADIVDAGNAEEVAARVPGVIEVVDELKVSTI
jgi:hypothetical protein